jgi:hypothetical protein
VPVVGLLGERLLLLGPLLGLLLGLLPSPVVEPPPQGWLLLVPDSEGVSVPVTPPPLLEVLGGTGGLLMPPPGLPLAPALGLLLVCAKVMPAVPAMRIAASTGIFANVRMALTPSLRSLLFQREAQGRSFKSA